ncbi:hypothetical protein Tco_1478713, partial [Tanacetum coccineum]
VPTPPHDSPLLGGHTPRSDEGRMQLTELMDLVIKLSDKVLALETDLQQTKKVYSTAVTKLIMKVKRLEKIVKSSKARRRAKIVVPDDQKTSTQEDHPEDQLGVLSAAKVLIDVARVHTYSRRRRTVSTRSGEVSTASRIISTAKETVSTAGASMPVSTTGLVQEITSSSRASNDKEDEWENIRARVEADEELTQKLQAEEREKYSEVDQAKMLRLKRAGQEALEEPAKRQKIGEASGSGEEQSAEKEVLEE